MLNRVRNAPSLMCLQLPALFPCLITRCTQPPKHSSIGFHCRSTISTLKSISWPLGHPKFPHRWQAINKLTFSLSKQSNVLRVSWIILGTKKYHTGTGGINFKAGSMKLFTSTYLCGFSTKYSCLKNRPIVRKWKKTNDLFIPSLSSLTADNKHYNHKLRI